MTITETAPTTAPAITPCPPWCKNPAGHPWDERNVAVTDDYGRLHRRHVGEFVSIHLSETVPAIETDRAPRIEVDVLDIDCREDAEALVAAIQTAIDLAFPVATR